MVLTASENNTGNGAAIYGVNSMEIGQLTLDGFTKQCLQLGYANMDIRIGDLTMKNFRGDGFFAYQQGKVWDRLYPHTKNVKIDKLQLVMREDYSASVFNIGAIDNFKIGTLKAEKI